MRTFLRSTLFLAVFAMIGNMAHAQLSGVYTVDGTTSPTTFSSLADAVNALNTQGVGTGGVTINIAAGTPQTAPAGGYQLGSSVLNASTSSANKLTINGNSNVITAPVGTATTGDGIFFIKGTDYLTIDGLNLTESAANTTPTQAMEYGYALVNLNGAAPFDGVQNTTIKNCSITLNRTIATPSVGIYSGHQTSASTTALTITALSDTHSNNKFYTNNITNVVSGFQLIGFSAATPFTLYDRNNDVGGSVVANGNTITNFGTGYTNIGGISTSNQDSLNVSFNIINDTANGGSSALVVGGIWGIYCYGTNSTMTAKNNTVVLRSAPINTSYFIYGIYANAAGTNFTIDNNTINVGQATGSAVALYGVYTPNGNNITCTNNNVIETEGVNGTVYGIYTSYTGTVAINNNTMQYANSAAVTGTYNGIYNSGTSISAAINQNNFNNITANTSGTVYLIYNSNNTPAVTINNNKIGTQFTRSASSSNTFYGIYNGSSPTGNTLISGNNFSNVTLTGSGSGYGIAYNTNTGVTQTVVKDTVTNWTIGTGTLAGLNITYGLLTTVDSNYVNNLSGGGTTYGILVGNTSTVASKTFANKVTNISTSGTSSSVYGIYLGGTTTTAQDAYMNNVNNITASGTSPVVSGIYVSSGNTTNIYNNFISALAAPTSTALNAIIGINIAGGTTNNILYNTIYLGSGGTLTGGSTFGGSGIYVGSTSSLVNVFNNIVNIKATGVTGYFAALKRTSGTSGTKPANITANNNVYFAPYIYGEGTTLSSATNLYYVSGGTSGTQDIIFNTGCGGGLYRRFMAESATTYEDNLVAGATAGTFAPSGASYAESSAAPSSVVSVDFANIARGLTPDIGALQFAGTSPVNDVINPGIAYTALPLTTYCTTPPTLIATITDASGINTTTGTKPRLYYKKATETNAFGGANTNAVNGWKYVEGTNSGSTFTFLLDYTLLNSAVAVGDSITYFVVAQDNAATPNVGSNTVGFAFGYCPSTVNILTAGGPIAATPVPNGFKIIALPTYAAVANPAKICISGPTALSVNVPAGTQVQWQQDNGTSTFVNIPGATSANYTTPTLTSANNYRAQILCNGSPVATSSPVAVTINNPLITSTTGAQRCGLGPVTLQAVANTGSTVQWYANATGGAPVASGNSFTTPSIGATTTYYAAARILQSLTSVTVGTGTTSSTSYDGLFYHFYGGKKTQYLFRASELTAAGLAAGNINSASFNITTIGTSYADFNISMKTTAATVMTSTLETGLQGVYNNSSVTPTLGANVYNFSTPFFWDGQSNVIMEVCWSNNNTGGTSAVNTMNSPGFVCSSYYRNDNESSSVVCGTTAATGTTSLRPNVIFTNAASCEPPRTAVIATVIPAAPVTLTSAQSGGVCTGTPVTVNVTSTTTTYKYYWVPTDSGSTITRTPATTIYFVLTAIDTTTGLPSSGCVLKDSIRININAKPPTPVISPNPATICEGSSTAYSAASVAPVRGQVPIRWINVTSLFKDAALTQPVTATDTISAPIYAAPITNQTYRAVANLQGCLSDTSAVGTLSVVPKFAPTITVVSPSTTTCFPGTITLKSALQPSSGYTYQWILGTADIIGATDSVYNAPVSGAYKVRLTARTPSACSYTTSAATNVTVNLLPATNITVTGSSIFCTGGSVALAAPTGTNFGYRWNRGGVALPNDSLRTYTATIGGDYTVTVTNKTTGCVTTTPTPTTVTIATPPAPISAVAATNTICNRDTIRLRTNNAQGLTYQWYLGGSASSNAIAGATDSVYKAYLPGTYYVIVSVAGQASCNTTSLGLTVTVNPLPIPVISASSAATTFCTGGNVVLTATPANYTYLWRVGSANATAPNTGQTYTATAAGSYRAIITNPTTGCVDTSNAIAVTVNALPTATATAATSATICSGNSVVINANTGTGLTYQWYNGTGLIPGATTGSYTANAAGAYNVRVTNANNCIATSSSVTVIVNPLPTATIAPTGSMNLCTGDTATLVGPTGTGYSYQWKLGTANAPGTSTNKDYKATAAGSYTVVVTASSCPNTSAATTITLLPVPTAAMTPTAATAGCDTVRLASSNTGVTYQWKFNGNDIIGATTANYPATATGNYSVRVTNPNGCSATTAATAVTINQRPGGTITSSSPLSFCEGGAVVLNANSGANQTYQWRRNGTAIAGATTNSYITSQSGAYTVNVANTVTGCTRLYDSVVVRVNPLPTPTVVYNGAINQLSVVELYPSYRWLKNGQPQANAVQSTYIPTVNGAYSVVVVDTNGCTNVSQITFISSLGINNAALAATVKVYPNPTTGLIYVNAPAKVNLSVRDISGKIVTAAENATQIDVEPLADGMYLLYVTDAQNQLIKVEKITKSAK